MGAVRMRLQTADKNYIIPQVIVNDGIVSYNHADFGFIKC